MSSPTSSATPAEIIGRILNTDTGTPGYLQRLVTNIDTLLDQYTTKGKQTATEDKLSLIPRGLPSPAHVAAFSEEASKNVKLISDQISKSSGDKHSTAVSMLNAIGNVHWVGVGFLLVAAVIERLDKMKQNKKECLGLLKSMNDLAKLILQLQRLPHLKEEMNYKMEESIQLIVYGVILCCTQKKRNFPLRLWVAGTDGEELGKLRSQVDEMGRMLHSQISLSTLDAVQSNVVCSKPPVPFHNPAVVGIDHKITEVIQLLEWDNDKSAVAVIVHGIGGAGKTTLANEVFATLNLHGWKYSKVTLVKNLESNPNIDEIQTQILSDLTGIKHDKVRDFQDGQQKLKSIMEKEVVFIYIDNILKREHLEHLLPKLSESPEKVRILVTARKTNVSGVLESCRFNPCKLYAIESLSDDASLQVLCRKIDTERDIDSMVGERPQAKEIANKCSCCPLFLEVVGAYLHKRNNRVEAYEKIVSWLSDGEDFSCDKDDSFEESRILFAYNELTPSAQEAFLDICSFFYDWEWDAVASIVGEEEMDCLLEGALVKRVKADSYHDESYRLNMHDLLLRAGRNKSKGNRYTNEEDISMALESEGDLHQIRGIWLQYINKPYHLSAEVLESMSRSLRVLAMGEDTIVSGQCSKRFDELRILQARKVPNLGIDISKLQILRFLDYTLKKNETLSLPNFSGLQVLKLRKACMTDMHAEIEFGHFSKLKHLELKRFHITEVSSFVKVYGLKKLKLNSIEGLKELPGSIGKLRSLQKLSISDCDDLMRLEEGFGELSSLVLLELTNSGNLQELSCDFGKLSSLESLNLISCRNLLKLPEEIENLSSLKFVDVRDCSMLTSLSNRVCELSFWENTISLRGCKSLRVLPAGFGQFSCLDKLVSDNCESLQELCDDFHCLVGLKILDMSGCKSLSSLPDGFGQLGCLERLVLSGCEKLEELCGDFGCLGALKDLDMSTCRSLSKLPDGFGQLGCLESLKLSRCEKLQELCSDFGCLGALRSLKMSTCRSLSKLPHGFGQLGCLQRLILSGCEKLQELCSDFGCLGALEYLDMSTCKRLSKLPDGFGQLGCLERLVLSRCGKLQELCSGFGCLRALKYLDMSICRSLSKLPDGFGQLVCLESLELSGCEKLQELCSDFGCLRSLKYLDMSTCRSLSKLPDGFGQLGCLESLELSGCEKLQELCSSFGCLRALKYLDMSTCRSLSKLPDGFSQLGCLESLELSGCEKLQELCSNFGCLRALKYLDMSICKSLSKLPNGFGQLVCLECLELSGCEKLQELCSDFRCLRTLKCLDMSTCRNLPKLPDGFGQLGCLESLELSGCEQLHELCSDFGCLRALKYLDMSTCKSLSKLPNGFGQLGCLESLELSGCEQLHELCSDFGCLGFLQNLEMSRCKSLSKLPDGLGQLGCLETLDLSMCSKLEDLCSDFHWLTSLVKLDLSNCERIGEKWMDYVGTIEKLWRLDISGSEKIIRRWIEMQREIEDWNFVVLTKSFWEETEEGRKALLLKAVTSQIFDEGILIDNHGRPFWSFPPATSLIFIIEVCGDGHPQIDGVLFEKGMRQLEWNSRACSIIYTGRHFSELPSEVTNRIVAYTPPTPETDLFFEELSATFPEVNRRQISVFRSRVCSEIKGIKCPSVWGYWEDVSYILNETAFLLRAPSESNVGILKAMLQTDFLLKKNRQVKLIDSQGKVILLLRTRLTMYKWHYSAFHVFYMKMQASHQNLIEVVWVPHCSEGQRDKFERVAADAPWPVVGNPWLIQQSLSQLFTSIEVPDNEREREFPSVVVFDGKGRIMNKNAWEMIERWGEEAFPFSGGRQEELRKSEWEKMRDFNQFLFQNLPLSGTEVKQGSPCAKMMLLFVGRARDMLELGAEVEYALPMLKSHFQLCYLGRKHRYSNGRGLIVDKMSNIPCIVGVERYRFWERMKYLYNDLTRMGSTEKVVNIRSLVCGIISAETGSVKEEEIEVIVVDEKGEMATGRGKQVVEALLQYVENHSELPSEVTKKGIRAVLEGHSKDGIIHSKRHPDHLMLQISELYANPRCSLCSRKSTDDYYYYYQCSACENHVMCQECILE